MCSLSLCFLFLFLFYLYLSFSSPGMTTRFSKKKLAEAQEKKARSGIVGGLLSRKHQKMGDAPSRVPVVTPCSAHSLAKRPSSPTSSLEVIVSLEGGVRRKSVSKYFWDNLDAAVLKAREALSVDDLNPLMVKSSSDVMSSHIQKLVQVCFDDVGCFFFFVFLLLREIFSYVGFGGVLVHLWEASGFGEEGGYN